jgi:hypothetical protein
MATVDNTEEIIQYTRYGQKNHLGRYGVEPHSITAAPLKAAGLVRAISVMGLH